MRTIIRSNAKQLSARYQRMARNFPGVVKTAIGDLARNEAVPLFQNTVATWTHRPTFETTETPRGWRIDANPQYPYGWVNNGTPRHPIPARNKPYLIWNYPFTPKSKPRMISSFAGGVGRKVASKKQVYNQIRARNFTDTIVKRVQPKAGRYVREALNKASYGAGQGL